jgi:uncharacterized RmlC-like cupin family protein
MWSTGGGEQLGRKRGTTRRPAEVSARACRGLEASAPSRFGAMMERGHMSSSSARWRSAGVRIIRPGEFDSNIEQTPGLRRLAAVTTQNSGATKLWAGTFTVDAKAKTGPHHHGDLETVIYVLNGVARLRWGERLEFEAEAAAGDFIYVPPYVPHQEINPSPDLQLQCVLARSGQKGLVFNLDIEGVETPELVRWIDDLHK